MIDENGKNMDGNRKLIVCIIAIIVLGVLAFLALIWKDNSVAYIAGAIATTAVGYFGANALSWKYGGGYTNNYSNMYSNNVSMPMPRNNNVNTSIATKKVPSPRDFE